MKKFHLFQIVLLCFCTGLVGCSDDDSSGETPTNPTPTEGNFTQRVLVEDYTSVWCGNCPRVAFAIDSLMKKSNKVVPVGIHGPFGGQNDPFQIDYSPLKNKFNIEGLPEAKLNRTEDWSYPQIANIDQALSMTGQSAPIGLAINPSLNNGNLKVSVNTKFGADFSSNNLKLVVYVLESGLTHKQKNYTEYYGGPPKIENFEFNHVLRAGLTALLGDPIPDGKVVKDQVYTREFSRAVSSMNISNTSNISIVAFVVNGNGTAINVRQAPVGATQNFQTH